MGRVVVVGSYNVGFWVVGPSLPEPGQTVLGHTFGTGPGGKGSNQAIGLRRLGADVTFVVKLGDDRFAEDARELFRREALLGEGVLQAADTHTGAGLILIDDDGANMIGVAPGANARLAPEDLDVIPRLFDGASHLLCQLECPPELFAAAAARARAQGVTTILNPAPAAPLDDPTLALVDLLTPNETELGVLAGRPVEGEPEIEAAARSLLDRGVGVVVVTLGERGALLVQPEGVSAFEARPVRAVDTTGAGDAFNAGLVAGLAAGSPLADAIALGLRAGAFCVTRLGVVEGLPTMERLAEEVPA
ncbi:MAG TPA: ribokinase [Actinomycetota bacterium]|nr:ribokinase [Actinomycetota bacterium]